ncbi:MAG: hypothetical protein HKN29_08335 [Rhodothermales bacterium]|nr:hypothetical protein [Rhodothermales bacterium]
MDDEIENDLEGRECGPGRDAGGEGSRVHQELAAFEQHVEHVRAVLPGYDPPHIDFWSPETIDALTGLTERKGKITGAIGRYRVQYFEGRYLPVELNLFEAATGRRIAQDGSEDIALLERLRARVGKDA